MKSISITEKLVLTINEAGALSGLGHQKIRDHIKEDPTFPCFRDGCRWKIPRIELQEWVSKKLKCRPMQKQ